MVEVECDKLSAVKSGLGCRNCSVSILRQGSLVGKASLGLDRPSWGLAMKLDGTSPLTDQPTRRAREGFKTTPIPPGNAMDPRVATMLLATRTRRDVTAGGEQT